MTNEESVGKVFDTLAAMCVPYVVVGSLASNYYGIARSTQDADFVLHLGNHSISEVVGKLGSHFIWNRQMSFETVTGTLRYDLQLTESDFKVEFFLLSEDPHDQERFQRRRPVRLLNREVCVLCAEDVVISKLRWYRHAKRTKDLDDVQNVIAVSGDKLDWPYIYRWCDLHGTREQVESLRNPA